MPDNAALEKAWQEVKAKWRKTLEVHGVALPSEGSMERVWLAVLWIHQHEPIHKECITKVVQRHHPEASGDQQVRHLRRKGWSNVDRRKGWCQVNFDFPDPSFLSKLSRAGGVSPKSWEEVKIRYGSRCAWCHISDGATHWATNRPAVLQQGHRDPHRPLTLENCISLCDYHNQALRDMLVLNAEGFPEAVASIALVMKASPTIKRAIIIALRAESGAQ